MQQATPEISVGRHEAWAALAYFGLYLAWLFIEPESEFMHWATLVALPLALLVLLRSGPDRRPGSILASVGLRRGNLSRGLAWAIVVGLLVSALQLVLSRQSETILGLIRSGRALYLFPLSFLLMLLTAGFTEEFFFRGVLQTRLETLLRSRILAVIAASLAFGVYHLPYAYLNPNWPSAGDWGAAWSAALGQAVPAGLILGTAYILSRRNLVACAIMHALFNSLPAMALIRFGGG